jgi:flagellar basal body rod protein FlgB
MGLIDGITNIASSMQSVTKALKANSDNIANLNTPGYIAKQGSFSSREMLSPRGNLLSGSVTYQIQDVSSLAKNANQILAGALGEKVSQDTRTSLFSTSAPQLNIINLSERFANTANPQNSEIPIIELQSGIKDQILEFRRVGKTIDFGITEFQRLSEQKAEIANSIFAEYQRVGASNPNDPRIQQLEQAYAEIAGWPPVPKADITTAQGGELQGMRRAIEDLNITKQKLTDTYGIFSQDVNSVFDNPVLTESMDDDLNLNGQLPRGIPEFSLQNYNTALGAQQSNNTLQKNIKADEYLATKTSFDQQYGVDMEREITSTMQHQRQYEALTKLVQTYDQMIQSTINMKT